MKTTSKKTFVKGIRHFQDKGWFRLPSQSKFWIRFYTSTGIPWKFYKRIFKKAPKLINYDQHPVKFHYAILSELDFPRPTITIVSHEDGTPTVIAKTDKMTLPESSYIVLTSPIIVDGRKIPEFEVKKRLDIIESVFNMHFGSSYLGDIAFEGIVSAHDSKLETSSSWFTIPFAPPSIHPLNWKNSKAILKKIDFLAPEKKNSVELSLTLFEKGLREKGYLKFFYYWVSIEVLCETNKTKALTAHIATYYNIAPKDAETKLYCDSFYQVRRDFFHRGKLPLFSPLQERYVQLFFLDLLRMKLSLKNNGNLYSFLQAIRKNPFQKSENKSFKSDTVLSEDEKKLRRSEYYKSWEQHLLKMKM